jgi:hypothetical protein
MEVYRRDNTPIPPLPLQYKSSFVPKDSGGEMYFCNARCFSIWAILWATRPDLTQEQRAGEFLLTTPVGEQRAFKDLIEVAQWATSNALAMSGRD